MRRVKAWVRAFFGFTKTETNAFIILLPLMMAILFSEPIYRAWLYQRAPSPFDFRTADSLMMALDRDSVRREISPPKTKTRLFTFDPNSATQTQFIELGLPSAVAARIIRYREKGGKFRKKDDLLKVFGLDSSWFEKAKAWTLLPEKSPPPDIALPEKKTRTFDLVKIDINQADSAQLVAIYGIGPAMAKRLRTFRDRLGGFVSMEQVKEVYGLDSIVAAKMKERFFVAEHFAPATINLNTTTLEQLMHHPYIKRNEASAILSYRHQRGRITTFDDLLQIKILSPSWLDRVRPYVTLE